MPSTTPLTDAINALTTYANTTTGASDTTLSDAVATLVEGYGGGGSQPTMLDLFNRNISGDISFTVDNPETELTTSTDPVVTQCFAGAFKNTDITTLTVNGLAYLPTAFAYGCTDLTSVSMPDVIYMMGSKSQFQNCTSLVSVSLPSLTTSYYNWTNGGSSMFEGCTSLTTVNMRKVDRLSNAMFRSCTSLELLEFDQLTNIDQLTFRYCTNLTTLILRSTSVVVLGSVNSFWDTPFKQGGTGGTIYVPSALISEYQSAAQWSTLHGYGTVTWVAIEGSQYENYHADGTPVA